MFAGLFELRIVGCREGVIKIQNRDGGGEMCIPACVSYLSDAGGYAIFFYLSLYDRGSGRVSFVDFLKYELLGAGRE